MAIFKRISKLTGEVSYTVRLRRKELDANGKKAFVFKTFPTKKEAEAWETDQKHALKHHTYIEPSDSPLATYLRGWLTGAVSHTVRAGTLEGYQRLVERYLVPPPLGSTPLARLATADLERFYAGLRTREKPLAARSVVMIHGVLRQALTEATRDRLIAANPAIGGKLPRQVRSEPKVFDRVQLKRFLATSEATGNRHHALWCVLATGGLRPSEALRLTWDDVGADYVLVRGETKTAGSRRKVKLPASTMLALAWHRTQQEAEQIAAGSAYRDRGLVFASLTGGSLDLKNVTARHFKPLLVAYYPLPNLRVYDLRHTHITHALSAGRPVHVVAKRVGHSSAKMTLDVYSHWIKGDDEAVVEKLEAFYAAD
jgi:integrase